MVTVNPSIYRNPSLALEIYRPQTFAQRQTMTTSSVANAMPDDLRAGDVNTDDFIYGPTGKLEGNPVGEFHGLPDASTYHVGAGDYEAKVAYEVKMGDTVLGRVYDTGQVVIASGFDVSSLDVGDPDAVGDANAAADNAKRLLDFFSSQALTVDLAGADGNVQENSKSNTSSANFWADSHSVAGGIDVSNPDYQHFLDLISENGGYEKNAAKTTQSQQRQDLKDSVVRTDAPKRAADLVMWTSGLNQLIAASQTELYQTDEAYRNKIDTFIGRLKGVITNDVNYLSSQTDISGSLIKANDDGTYSNPDFTIRYNGSIIYSHPRS